MFASKDTLLTRPSGYTIARSVRLRSSATGYFSRTPSSTTNRRTWTWSGWMKRGTDKYSLLFAAGNVTDIWNTGTNCTLIGYWISTNQLAIYNNGTVFRNTAQVFRDPSAWYHIVVAFDTTQATAANRLRVYINGAEVTSWDTNVAPTQNLDMAVNVNQNHFVGGQSTNVANAYFDGYLTEVNFIDGQQLTPSSFGETDSITGVWKPKAYSGTYGTNGFYLNFSDNSSNTATTIGKDYSGNGNNWTPNNISVTAGVTYDSMTDVPTPTSATAANYCVLNPLAKALSNGGTGTTTNGNLTIAFGATNWYGHKGSIAVSSGKWYYEVVNTSGTNFVQAGFTLVTVESETATGVYRYRSNGNKVSTAYVAYGAAWNSAGDIAGVAFDADTGEITFYRNGVSQGSAFTSIPAGLYAPEVIVETGTTANVNFGQRPFTYTPPTGFVALNTYNLPESTIKNGAAYMAATLYTGTGSSLAVSNAVNGSSFQPDLVWVKSRSAATDHALYDSVRGTQSRLESNTTDAQATSDNGLTAFGSGGFTVNTLAQVNTSSATYVGWQWKAGGTSSSNTNGSITSTVSAGATQGFSVVTYTGNGTLNATIGHGLGVAPSMVIIKNRVGANNWDIYHISNGAQKYMDFTTAGVGSLSTIFPTTPTSSVVYLGTTGGQNTNATNYVAYCFSAVAGYSAIGSYTGNSSTDGTFVYTGFRPRFVLIKGIGSGGSGWQMNDSSRNTYNPEDAVLRADLSNAETTAYGNVMDFLSNGFKLRVTDTNYNSSSTTYGPYIYMAFAENPFKNSLAR